VVEGKDYRVELWSVMETSPRVLYLDYTNHRGEQRVRRVIPMDNKPPRYGPTPDHPNPTWTIRVYDLDRHAERSYELTSIHYIGTSPPTKGGQ
jgi:hypothetical protein